MPSVLSARRLALHITRRLKPKNQQTLDVVHELLTQNHPFGQIKLCNYRAVIFCPFVDAVPNFGLGVIVPPLSNGGSVAFAYVVDRSLHRSKVGIQGPAMAPTRVVLIPAVVPVQLDCEIFRHEPALMICPFPGRLISVM